MKYKLETSSHVSSLYQWANVFASISLPLFGNFYDDLGFPFPPTESLRQFGHDFALSYAVMMNNPEYQKPLAKVLSDPIASKIEYNLLDNTHSVQSLGEKHQILFDGAFNQLAKMNYADAIYTWGKETRNYSKYTNEWKYIQLRKLGDKIIFLSRWARGVYSVMDVPLDEDIDNAIQNIILDNRDKRRQFQEELQVVLNSYKAEWENFVLYTLGMSSWLELEANHRINQNTWKKLTQVCSDVDLEVLESWLEQNSRIYQSI